MAEKGWQRWIEPVVAVSVVISLIVLIAEVRTNTRALDRQSRMDQLTILTQPFLDDVALGDVLAKIKAVDGREATVVALMDTYALTDLEATSWHRHLFSIWGAIEADFLYSGSEFVESNVRALLPYTDAKLYWATNRGFHSSEFAAFVDEIMSELDSGG